MKIRTETISTATIVKNYYACEFCQKEYERDDDAAVCELDCREKQCRHDVFTYKFDKYFDCDNQPCHDNDIIKKCNLCGKILASKDLEKATEEQIKQIWEIL